MGRPRRGHPPNTLRQTTACRPEQEVGSTSWEQRSQGRRQTWLQTPRWGWDGGDDNGAGSGQGQRSGLEGSAGRSLWDTELHGHRQVNWTLASPRTRIPRSFAPDQQTRVAESHPQLQTQREDVIFKASWCLGLVLKYDSCEYSPETTGLTRVHTGHSSLKGRKLSKVAFCPH